MSNQLEELRSSLSRRMWRTASSRFEARRRLNAQQNWSNNATSLLAGYILCLSIGIFYLDPEIAESTRRHLSFFTVVSSLLLIIVRSLERGKNYGVRAEKLYQSGVRVGGMEEEIRMIMGQIRGILGNFKSYTS